MKFVGKNLSRVSERKINHSSWLLMHHGISVILEICEFQYSKSGSCICYLTDQFSKRISKNLIALGEFFTHEYSRHYTAIKLPHSDVEWTFSWSSDLIDPMIINYGDKYWIGVDEQVAALSADGQLCFLMPLSSVLLVILEFNRGVIVICELSVGIINQNGTIDRLLHFSEIIIEYVVNANTLRIVFLDGTSQSIAL